MQKTESMNLDSGRRFSQFHHLDSLLYKEMYGLNENEYDTEFRSCHALKTIPPPQGLAFDLGFDVL